MHESLSLLRIGRESRNHERQPGLCHYRTCGNAWKLHTEFVTINQSFFSTRPEGRVPPLPRRDAPSGDADVALAGSGPVLVGRPIPPDPLVETAAPTCRQNAG